MYSVRVEGYGEIFQEDDAFSGYLEDAEAGVYLTAPSDGEMDCPDCGLTIENLEDHDEACDSGDWLPSRGIENAFNWIGAEVVGDEVRVYISVGDPRGCFSMTFRVTSDGTRLLHVPHPSEGLLHAKLTEIHPGTYKVGD